MTNEFHQGSAHVGDPEIYYVLRSLIDESNEVEQFGEGGFYEWLREYGDEEEDNEQMWNTLWKQNRKLHKFLGDDYKRFVNALYPGYY